MSVKKPNQMFFTIAINDRILSALVNKGMEEGIPKVWGDKIINIKFVELSHGIRNGKFNWTKVWADSSVGSLSFDIWGKGHFQLFHCKKHNCLIPRHEKGGGGGRGEVNLYIR